jgi:hypothetical protein
MMTRLEYLLKQHENALGWYRQSEEKAKFIVTLNTLVVGVVNGLVFIGAEKVGAVRRVYTAPIWLLLTLSGIALLGSYIFTLRAIWPRHHARDATLKRSERLWFFGDVASMTRKSYQAAMAHWTERDLEGTMIVQNHLFSTNVWVKHENLNRAIVCTIVALMFLFGLGVAYGIAVASTPR